MKTVDEKYSYDEFEGFTPVNLKSRICVRDVPELSAFEGRLMFNVAARKILFERKYIRIAYNAETRQMLITSVTNEGTDTIRITASAGNQICCKPICDLLEKESRFDLHYVRLKIPGTVSRTKKNVVIFDLTAATTVKPLRRKQKNALPKNPR